LSPIPSRFNHSIKDWRCRQMWLFVLCQEHSTDFNYQCQLHWHPVKTNKIVDRLFQDWISFWVRKRIIHWHYVHSVGIIFCSNAELIKLNSTFEIIRKHKFDLWIVYGNVQ
jgi:hypothetical protein